MRRYDRVFLGIDRDETKAASYALEYSNLSLTYPKLYEIGFDDFYVFWRDSLKFSNSLLGTIIDNTKKVNTHLKFGITLYSDEVPLTTNISYANRGKVDYVHLYPHFRKTDIEGDVAKAKALFPNAKIIAGAYALDFKSSCLPGENGSCSGQTELKYFIDSFQRQVNLMKTCQVDSIEFWPGYFGNEGNIDYQRCLAKGNTQEVCVQNTVNIRNGVINILRASR
jgi:hypothetical protein